MYIAEHLAKKGQKVTICEKDDDFMQRASYNNQARVHNGYHYPRSTLTALRSCASFPIFTDEFKECIDSSFDKYYMIGKILGKVSAKQFKMFCERIGLCCDEAPPAISKLTNPQYIEASFSTQEYAFNARALKERMLARIHNAGVNIELSTKVISLQKDQETFIVEQTKNGKTFYSEVDQIFNCTYSMLNSLLNISNIPTIPLKHEMTEMCLVEVPDILKDKGITIMCGPFFSIMPFPDRGLHTLSHVRYTPHYEWHDTTDSYIDAHKHFSNTKKVSAYNKMLLDSKRYLPCMAGCLYKDSLWEVKTVLPRSEIDDSRPILFKENYFYDKFHCIMGGKIDNIYDAISIIKERGLDQ